MPLWSAFALFSIIFLSPTVAVSEDSRCSAGTFYSDIQRLCAKPNRYNTLPLDATKPMRFQAVQQSMMIVWIQATGTITEDTPTEFERFLKTDDARLAKKIYFHSPGGNLLAGLKLGELIRKAGYNTGIGRSLHLDGAIMDIFDYEESFCASACAYAFLGGVTRSYGEKHRYGLHRFGGSDKLNSDGAQIVTSLIAAYIERMGANQAVLQLASITPFDGDILWVPENLGRELKVIFDRSGVADFRIEQRGKRTVAVFDFAIQERLYGGMILCGNGTPMLTVFDPKGTIPEDIRAASDFPAEFETGSGGHKLAATATYFLPTKKGGAPYMLFQLPGLRATMFEGDGLRLSNIWNPQIVEQTKGKTGFDAFYPRVRWADAVSAFQVWIKSENASRTLPLVLNSCRNRPK